MAIISMGENKQSKSKKEEKFLKSQSVDILNAIKNQDRNKIYSIIKNNNDLNFKDSKGRTPLMWAVSSGLKDVVRFLIDKDKRLDLDCKDHKGRTALIRAVKMGDAEMVKILIEAGADINIKNDKGQTAVEIADKEKIILLLNQNQETRINKDTNNRKRNDLNYNKSKELTVREERVILKSVDDLISKHKNNSHEIKKMVTESITLLNAGKAKAKEIAEQGKIKNIWNTITFKNKKMRVEKDKKLIAAQHASKKLIEKLAEQNLLTTKLIENVNNKVNNLEIEINKSYKRDKEIVNKINNLEAEIQKLKKQL